MSPTMEEQEGDALATAYDAGAVRTPGWLAAVSALASVRPEGIGATIDWLVAHRAELEAAYESGRTSPLTTGRLPPEMQYTPELGYLDRGRDDHALRGRWIFADVAGKMTFFQAAIFAITGIELSPEHASMLEELAVVCFSADARAWPMTVTRRVAARGGGPAAAVVAGQAMMGSTMLAGAAAADCARFLHRARSSAVEGRDVDGFVRDVLAQRERVMGFGRPVVGPDERVPRMEAALWRHGRGDLTFVSLLRAADAAFLAQRGLRSTAAAWAAAALSDFGMSPVAVQATCNFWVSVTVFAQAVYSDERRTVAPLGGGPEVVR
jgi:hypothetical protein